MNLAWLTDIHLDCADNPVQSLRDLRDEAAASDALIISGDISIGPGIVQHLGLLEDVFEKPIFFVLGNHDYYYSDIMSVRRNVKGVCRNMSYSKYLGSLPYVLLDNRSAIVGADGWYDGFNGNCMGSEILMNDWIKIQDFSPAIQNTPMGKQINKQAVLQIARAICKDSVSHVINGIKAAADRCDKIIIVTHVPPFLESYTSAKFKDADANHIVPWYTSKMMGEAINAAANHYTDKQFVVLSGHTHSSFEGNLAANLEVHVGKSVYGTPQIAGYIDT